MRLFKQAGFGAIALAFAITAILLSSGSIAGATSAHDDEGSLTALQAAEIDQIVAENEALRAENDALRATNDAMQVTIDNKNVRIENGIEWRMRVQSLLWKANRNVRALEGEIAAIDRAPSLAEQDIEWIEGYIGNGGQHLSSFIDVILPCESKPAAFPDPHGVVGPTDDWGRAQVNRPVWRSTFESLTDEVFETGIIKPELNGFMAAHIETVQGLNAWTCWRNR